MPRYKAKVWGAESKSVRFSNFLRASVREWDARGRRFCLPTNAPKPPNDWNAVGYKDKLSFAVFEAVCLQACKDEESPGPSCADDQDDARAVAEVF